MTVKLWMLFAALVAAPVGAGAGSPPAKPDLARFGDAISVGLATVRVRIVDPAGSPILGLPPAAVRVRIGRHAVPVVALDYYDSVVSAADAPDELVHIPPGEARRHSPHQVSARGQMFIFAVEADTKAESALDTVPPLKGLVDGLPPEALAAVVSLDSGLRLELDLTRDREAVFEAILRGRQGGPGIEPPAAPEPLSLARGWRAEAARRVARPDRALSLLAAALAPLPGEKVLIFVGKRSGHLSLPASKAGQPETEADLRQTIRNLQLARASLFALDEPRSFGTPTAAFLRTLAASTGGAYAQAGKLERQAAIERLMRQTRGYYLLTFNLERLQETARDEPLTVELAGRKGTILACPFRVVSLGS